MFTQSEIYYADPLEALPSIPDNSCELILTYPGRGLTLSGKHFFHGQFIRLATQWIIVIVPPEEQWPWEPSEWLFIHNWRPSNRAEDKYSREVLIAQIYKVQGGGEWYGLPDQMNLFNGRDTSYVLPRIIKNHTKEGDRVFDPFCGYGTIPITADSIGRIGIGIEENEQLADIAHNDLHRE